MLYLRFRFNQVRVASPARKPKLVQDEISGATGEPMC